MLTTGYNFANISKRSRERGHKALSRKRYETQADLRMRAAVFKKLKKVLDKGMKLWYHQYLP